MTVINLELCSNLNALIDASLGPLVPRGTCARAHIVPRERMTYASLLSHAQAFASHLNSINTACVVKLRQLIFIKNVKKKLH